MYCSGINFSRLLHSSLLLCKKKKLFIHDEERPRSTREHNLVCKTRARNLEEVRKGFYLRRLRQYLLGSHR